MKKIHLIIIICFLILSCSSDDNNNSNKQILKPTIENISTNRASIGDIIIINGKNFNSNETYLVKFNEIEGPIIEITPTQLKVEIPENATSGEIVLVYNNEEISVGTIEILLEAEVIDKMFVIRDDFTNKSILEVNKTDGSIINTYNFKTDFPASVLPKSLIYETETKSIYGISSNTSSSIIDGTIVKYNIETNTESSIILPTLSGGDYGDIIIANNRLFVIKDDFTNKSILEVNKTDGSIINTYNFKTDFPASVLPKSLIYETETKSIYGISSNTSSSIIDGTIVKYNIETNTESSISLPTLSGGDYGDIIIANNRLFVIKDDFTNKSILEVNKTDGSIINTYNFKTDFPASVLPKSLIYETETKSIYGISSNTSSSIIDGTIVKYNIETNTESSISLPTLSGGDYGDIIIVKESL